MSALPSFAPSLTLLRSAGEGWGGGANTTTNPTQGARP
jgi:hypothetical protein